MTQSKKDQARQLASDLQKSTAPEAQQAKQMIGLLLEEAKHNLIVAEGDTLLRLQGEARLLNKLFEQLTTKRVELPVREHQQ